MTIQDIITSTTRMVQREAYTARVCDELYGMEFDSNMMKFHRDMAIGKACGGLEVLNFITEKSNDAIYDKAVEDATQDIFKVDRNIIILLDLAGFDGEAYYNSKINDKEIITMNNTINTTENIITAEDVANSIDYIKPYTTSTGYTIDTMTKLEYEVGAATDDSCIDIEYIKELKPIVLELAEIAAIVPNAYKIDIMLDWINEAEEDAENTADFEAIKAETLRNTGDKYLAEDVAWNLVYAG